LPAQESAALIVAPPRLSKSRYTAGLQCHKQLWWRVHEPDAPELVAAAVERFRLDQGTKVGERAREYVPGGCLIDIPHDRIEERVAATSAALAAGARVVYEASFLADRVFAAVDILERRGDGFGLIEVKSSTTVKPEHLPDVAIQMHVLRRAGLEVTRAEVMHLNRACTYPDLSDLYVREDVTSGVVALLPAVPRLAEAQLGMLEGPLPGVAIGPHCTAPHDCPFLARCWSGLPEHHVSTLYYAGKKAWDLESRGYRTIFDLPEGLDLHPAAERQRRSVREGRMIVEPGLGEALAAFRPPLAFLDFETVAPAIPVWEGCHPYDAVPVQFSCHKQEGGALAHFEWLAEGPEDSRAACAERLIAACAGAETVVAYNAAFERTCLGPLAARLDARLVRGIQDIDRRLQDMLPLVREHVYHPAFHGSFGLKRVLPALVPELSYEGLEVSDGSLASVLLDRLLFGEAAMQDEERRGLRQDLLRYCALDTLGAARLFQRLRELAAGG
jgi:predicted RecB family nuclease